MIDMSNKMKIIGVIPARYQSSRFPGKPLALILGKPMIWWVYQQCIKVPELDEVYVATDDERIYKTCEQLGMRVVMTSEQCHTGTDRVGEVAEKIAGDLYVNIQGDEPLIEPQMISDVIGIFRDEKVYYGSLRKQITDEEEISAQSTVKVVVDKNEDALYFSRSVIPSNVKDGRLARVYRHVGIYAYKREFLQTFIQLPPTELEAGEGLEQLRALENGYKLRVHETQFDTIGVDLPEHIPMVEKLIRSRDNINCTCL
jgi:3-deoxy-D-manno-octulosonate cytidylyltransferase